MDFWKRGDPHLRVKRRHMRMIILCAIGGGLLAGTAFPLAAIPGMLSGGVGGILACIFEEKVVCRLKNSTWFIRLYGH